MSGIIVGVDGSEHSLKALRWALIEAAAHHAPVTVMTVHPAAVRPGTMVFCPMPLYAVYRSGPGGHAPASAAYRYCTLIASPVPSAPAP